MVMFMLLFVMCAILGYAMTPKKKISLPVTRQKEITIRTDSLYLICCLLPLFLICGLRAVTVGIDTNDYVDSFLDPAVLDRTVGGEAKFELGYTLFVRLIRLFSDNPHVFIFATAVVIFVGLYLFIRDNCKGSYAIALMVYVAFLYYIDFSAIRQAMALSIAINSVKYLRKRQWIPAALIIVLGGLFHTTALLLLVMIPFSLTPWDEKKVVIAFGLAVAGTLLFEPLVGLVLKFLPIYERYWNSEMMEGSGGIGLFAMLVIALSGFAAVMLFLKKARFKCKSQRAEFLVALIGSIFTIAINLLGRKYGIFSRMTRYFIPFVMILVADVYKFCIPARYIDINEICSLIKHYNPEKHPNLAKCRIRMKDLFYLMVAGLMLVYYFTIMRTNLYVIIPYSFFFG